MWYVVRDPGNNQFFRLPEAGYHFIGLLDGRRTVQQVWDACNEEFGDGAPTQGEALELLGQLYRSNLLAAEIPADAEGMFDRYKKRVRREVGSYLQNLLFIRIPLFDPDAFLDRWVGLFGLAFTKFGFLIWLVVMGFGINAIVPHFGELLDAGRSENLLDPDNAVWLYLSFAIIKGFHEFGHAFSCKKFGRDAQSGGEVHTIGIMFLVFMPVPYVDATSAWALRSKWQRTIIGAGGLYIELAIAAIAALIWAQTSPGVIKSMCFNMMFIASVSTILFNGNPLLRFDAYYILSDIIEVANLAQRGKEFIYYLVKRYIYGVRKPRNPAHSIGERFWLLSYGVCSFLYRIVICVGILMFVADKAFFLGAILAAAAIVTWVAIPIGKWIHYLTTHADLLRTRPRAIWSTLGFVGLILVIIGTIPMDEHGRAVGIGEPRDIKIVLMGETGFIESSLHTESPVKVDEDTLLQAENLDLLTQLKQLEADETEFEIQYTIAKSQNNESAAQMALEQLDKWIRPDLTMVRQRITNLNVTPPRDGTWVAAKGLEDAAGTYRRRGEQIGMVADFDDVLIRAVAAQELGPRLKEIADDGELNIVDVRVKGRPDLRFEGRIEDVYEAGHIQLPYQALSLFYGGPLQTQGDDPTRTVEQFFMVMIDNLKDEDGARVPVYAGQRVVIRFNLGARPLAVQWWRKIQQLVQRRFHTTL